MLSVSFDQVMAILGYAVLIVVLALATLALIMLVVTVISMRRGRFYLPTLLRPGLIIMEGLAKILWSVSKVDDREILSFSIRLHNQLNRERFSKLPMEDRMIFLPQCLRSIDCPSSLSIEGLVCKRCMRCEIGKGIDELESAGCRVSIVPGSTFVKRLVKKYRPKGIVGVGCLMEVKEGLEMTDQMDLPAMGVVTLRDGCVETAVDWPTLLEVATIRPGQ
ncbi:MAG: DUF116 domain-containing protein [Methanomassiliicoccus sp.]|nr:DUF116 domain-containing protein [Methanomassiliicoccus sp.]